MRWGEPRELATKNAGTFLNLSESVTLLDFFFAFAAVGAPRATIPRTAAPRRRRLLLSSALGRRPPGGPPKRRACTLTTSVIMAARRMVASGLEHLWC